MAESNESEWSTTRQVAIDYLNKTASANETGDLNVVTFPPSEEDDVEFAAHFAKVFTILHAIGLVLVALNHIYLKCTRGHGSVRARRCCGQFRRPCKVRSVVACNILIIYHTVLMSAELVIALISHTPYFSNVFMVLFFWALTTGSYIVLVAFCLPLLSRCPQGLQSHLGPVNGCNVLDLFNFIAFWLCVITIGSCQLSHQCNCLPEEFKNLGRAAVIPAVIIYIAMLSGSIYHYKHRFKEYRKHISKTEAVRILKEKVNEAPSIRWTVICGHINGSDNNSEFVETCHTEKTYGFPNTQVERFTNLKEPQQPTEGLFTKLPTKLKISLSVIAGEDVQEDLRLFKENVRKEHKGHDDIIKIHTHNRKRENYFVCDSTSTPLDFHWVWLVLFTLVGLSMPYRWYLYYRTGHLKVKIKKYVLKSLPNEGELHEPLTPTQSRPTPPTAGMDGSSVCVEMEMIPIKEKKPCYT